MIDCAELMTLIPMVARVVPAVVVLIAIAPSAQQAPPAPITPPVIVAPAGAAAIEQRTPGTRAPATLVESFDGLGVGFTGPQGSVALRQPSDNSLAVGPDHVVQTVNTRMAIFTKNGKRFETTGRVLYGPVATNNVFRGFGGACEERNNGDAVVRYDQIADRWLIVMPLFSRAAPRPDQPGEWRAGERAYVSPPGRPEQPGPAVALFQPPAPNPDEPPAGSPPAAANAAGQKGPYSMCYALSVGPDPFGPYYRYEFLRPLPGLPAPGDLARWLLRADEHRRRGDSKARLRRRSRADARRRARDRAVPDRR